MFAKDENNIPSPTRITKQTQKLEFGRLKN